MRRGSCGVGGNRRCARGRVTGIGRHPSQIRYGVARRAMAAGGIYLTITFFFSPNPIPDRCHSQQPASYPTVLVGLPFPLLPRFRQKNKQGEREERKVTKKDAFQVARAHPHRYILPGPPPPRAITLSPFQSSPRGTRVTILPNG